MKIALGKEFSGEQILEAFKKTASKLSLPESGWIAEELFCGGESTNRYEVKSGHLELLEPEFTGLAVYPQHLVEKRRWIIFGKKTKRWEKDDSIAFILSSLRPKGKYTEVKITIEITWWNDGEKYESINELESKEVQHYKPEFEKFISTFVEQLNAS